GAEVVFDDPLASQSFDAQHGMLGGTGEYSHRGKGRLIHATSSYQVHGASRAELVTRVSRPGSSHGGAQRLLHWLRSFRLRLVEHSRVVVRVNGSTNRFG